jgi:hypothetical protein
VSAPGVLANDSDIDSPTLSALLVSGPSHGTLTLKANGSFTYCPTSAFSGTDKFTYKVSDGSTVSNVGTVTIVVKPGSYSLINVRNLPPYAGVTFKPSANGTLVDFDWKFAVGGYTVASADALPSVTITGPGGYSKTFSPGAGCASTNDCTEFVYHTSDNTWDFDWKPKNAAVGTYNVVVRSGKTGQQFPGNDAYCIVFKK